MPVDPGLASSIDVSSQPVIPGTSITSSPAMWTWIWFVIAVLVVLGFHIRMFGRAVPPAANFP